MSEPQLAPIRSASVLLPTWQAMEFLDRVIDALASQVVSIPWDIVVVDSDSSDGTVERLLHRRAELPVPLTVLRIPSREFDHGDTRNLLASRSKGDLLVYLTQDAIPTHSAWLETLVKNFEDPDVGAVSCRNVPRGDASLSARVFCSDDPGYAPDSKRTLMPTGPERDALDADERRAMCSFQNVASAVRRTVWERYPFPRTMMGEDVLMARGVLEAGWVLGYDGVATVDHSHDYGPKKLHWRGTVDARFNAEWFGRLCIRERPDKAVQLQRWAESDSAILREIEPELAEDAATIADLGMLRSALADGLYEGGLAPKRYARSEVLERPELRVLLVTDAGVEGARLGSQYPFRLAKVLLDRGHAVTVAVLDSELAGGERVESQELGARAIRVGVGRAFEELSAELDVDVVHAFASHGPTIEAIRTTVESNRPCALTLLDEAALPGPGTDLHDLVACVDRVIVPTRRMIDALQGGALDQHRLELALPGLFASVPPRLKGCRPNASDPEVIVIGNAHGIDDEIRRALGRAHTLRDATGTARVGPDAEERLERLAGAACAVVLGDEGSVESLWSVLEAREAGIPCVVVRDSAAAEATWHDPNVHPAAREVDAVMEIVGALVIQAGGDSGALARRTDVPLKTLEEDAADMEVRYRVLVSIDRHDPNAHACLLEAHGWAFAGIGETIEQGGNRRVLLPGASATLTLDDVHGPVWLRLDQTGLAGEPLVLAGSISVDGRTVATLTDREPVDVDTLHTEAFHFTVPRGSRELRITAGGPDGANVRIDRVVIERRGVAANHREDAPSDESARPAPMGLLERCQSLEVPTVEAVPTEELPEVALIIPTLDGKALLAECLRSLGELDYPASKLHVYVVDNGSRDGTARWLDKAHPRVRVVQLTENAGFAEACNRGVAATAGEPVIAFVNNDMRFDRRFLVELVEPIVHRAADATTAKRLSWDGKNLDGAGVGSTFIGVAVQPGFGAPVGPEHEIRRRTLFPCGGAMAMTRLAFDDLGGFDADYFAYYEDLDLGWRAWVMGYDIHYIPTAVCEHHHSHTSQRFAPEIVRRMVIRNSVLTCLKNYDDENLARVMPAMTALAVERAFLKAGLDAGRFEPGGQKLLKPGKAHKTRPVSLDPIGAADLLALHDVFGQWPEVERKRRLVQSRRRRTDAELFPMFLEPLACVEGHASYQELQAGLVRWLGIDRMVEG